MIDETIPRFPVLAHGGDFIDWMDVYDEHVEAVGAWLSKYADTLEPWRRAALTEMYISPEPLSVKGAGSPEPRAWWALVPADQR